MINRVKQIDFKKYSTIKIGESVDVLEINEIGDYSDYYILGNASNVIVSPNPPKLAVLGKEFNYIKQVDDLLYIGCATKTGKVFMYTKNNDIGGLEFLGKLPGTMGGVVKMNAGLKEYEIFENLVKIKTKDGYINKKDIDFGYRYTNLDTICYEVVIKVSNGFDKVKEQLCKKMRDNQPSTPSAGSCFKNPKGDYAGRLIEAVGLKGFKVGDMSFSEIHANFLVNHGNGTFKDADFLIKEAKKRVFEQFNIKLELEIIQLVS